MVVAVVCGLLVTVLIFLHPKDTSVVERNAQRQLDTAHLMQVLKRYTADNGNLPSGITDKPVIIGSQSDEINLCKTFVPKYLKDMPYDPGTGGELNVAQSSLTDCTDENSFYSTSYTIQRAKDGTVTIAAPDAENKQKISISYKF